MKLQTKPLPFIYPRVQSGTMGYRQKNQGNRMERTEVNPHLHGHLIYNKRGKIIKWGKDSLYNEQVLGKLDGHMKINQTGLLYHTFCKNKVKMN